MNEQTKKNILYGVITIVLMLASGGLGYYLGGEASERKADEQAVEYAHGQDHDHEHDHDHEEADHEHEHADHDHEHDHFSEGENIVAQITDEGYATAHGDHFHSYNGKVPYDSVFSEELVMDDPNYTLKDEDIQYEVNGGYIIHVGDEYYVYLTDPEHADNIRNLEEMNE